MLEHIDKAVEDTKKLVVAPICGFGNRMLAIIGALFHKQNKSFNDVNLHWVRDGECDISYSDTIDAAIECHEEIIQSAIESYQVAPSIIHNKNNLYLKAVNMFPTQSIDQIERWARSHINEYLKIKKYQEINIKDDTIGIHCRRSDWGLMPGQLITEEQRAENHIQLDTLFANYIQNNYRDKHIFISTDSSYTLAYFKSRFKDRLIYNPKNNYPYFAVRSENSVNEAIKDFVTLSKCSKIIRDSSSTFSHAAGILGNKQIITWPRPIMVGTGHTVYGPIKCQKS